jgi:hypothetical protein
MATTTTNEIKPLRRGRPKKTTELLSTGKCITVRFTPTIEQQVEAAADEEGLLVAVWLRRLAVVELRRLRRGKAGN